METEDLTFEEHEDFNFDLDQSENPISILGVPYRASEVLFNMQRETYRIALTDFKNRQVEKLKEIIYYEYPLPIAFYFHQSENAYNNNYHRLQLLRSTWEAIIFTIYSLVVGEARSKNLPLRDIAQQNAQGNPDLSYNDYLSDRLAQKLLIIERILNYNQANNYALLCATIITIPTIQKIRSLNQERNEFMHVAAISEEQAAASYTALFPEVLDVLNDLRQLEFVDIMRFIQVADAVTNLRCEIFNGHGLARNIRTITVTNAQLGQLGNQLNSQNILAKFQGELFSITPFLHFRSEANGNTTNLCYFKRKVANAQYEYEIISRSEPVEFDRQIFQDRIDELRALIQ
jgi:hypothetical protein